LQLSSAHSVNLVDRGFRNQAGFDGIENQNGLDVARNQSWTSGQYQTFPCLSSTIGTGKSACLYRQL
jgi:hypothetical protein